MTNRNDLCYCGSNKKYKKCHLKYDEMKNELVSKGYEYPDRKLILTNDDIEGIKKAGVITRYLLDELKNIIKPGVTTDDIDKFVSEYTKSQNAICAPLNYHGFPKSCCTSINEVVCHGIPENRELKDGDIINVDITTILNGYYADASEMYKVGNVSSVADDLMKVTKKCLEIGMKEIKPLNDFNNIGKAIEKYIKENTNYSIVRDFGGHGVGKAFHTDPFVYHYDTKQKGMIMVPNMVFTIEPMINEGTYKLYLLDDDWTAVTRDNKLSAQYEHTFVVTEDGYEILV